MNRYTIGSTVRLYLDIVSSGAGVGGQSPTVAILRRSNGQWFDVSDGSWNATIVENAMVETDVTNLPGRYHFDFDQSLDDFEGSTEYIVKKQNLATPALEYEDLVFGPLAATASPELCSVQGTIYTGQGEPLENALVRASLQPVFTDGNSRGYQADKVSATYTNVLGDFDLPLLRGGIYRLEIDTVGYDRKVTIPDQASVLFTAL